jgi:hypothetical protein
MPTLDKLKACLMYARHGACTLQWVGAHGMLHLHIMNGCTGTASCQIQISGMGVYSSCRASPTAVGEQVCDACDTTTVRSIDPPYSYRSRESRRAVRKRAESFAQLIEENDLEVSNVSAWPGGWQSRIKADGRKVRCPAHVSSSAHIGFCTLWPVVCL